MFLCKDNDDDWMLVASNRLTHVTAMVLICHGSVGGHDIDGKVGIVVGANVEEHSYCVKFGDLKIDVCIFRAQDVTTLFGGRE